MLASRRKQQNTEKPDSTLKFWCKTHLTQNNAGINLTDYRPPPPGTPGLLHRNMCPAPGLLHNRKCPEAWPINDDVPWAGHLYPMQLAFKHENRQQLSGPKN